MSRRAASARFGAGRWSGELAGFITAPGHTGLADAAAGPDWRNRRAREQAFQPLPRLLGTGDHRLALPIAQRRRRRALRDCGARRRRARGASPPTISPRTIGGIAEADLGLGRMDIDVDLARREPRGTAPARHGGRAPASRHRRRAPRRPATGPSPAGLDEQILVVGHAAVEGRQARRPRPAAPLRAGHVDRDAILGQFACRQRAPPAPGDPRRPWTASTRRPSCSSVKPMSGRAMASRRTTSRQAAYSARGERRNLRRAGTRANNCSTRMRVPGGSAAGPSPTSSPLIDDAPPAVGSRAMRAGFRASAARRWRSKAAPRRESRASSTRSISSPGSFEVAWRSSASAISAGVMPQPSSVTSIRSSPPAGQAHCDPRRSGVDRIFDQFLQRAGRALDHFAGGDAVDQLLRQAAYMGIPRV